MDITVKLSDRKHNDGIQVIANLSYERGGRVFHASVNGTGPNRGVAVENLVKGARLKTLLKQALLKELTQKKMMPTKENASVASSTESQGTPLSPEPPAKPQGDTPPPTSEQGPRPESPNQSAEATNSEIPDGTPPESKSDAPAEPEDDF